MSSAYGNIARPKDYDSAKLNALLPIEQTTKSNQLVSIHLLATILQQIKDESKLLSYLQYLLNQEIEAGNTFPQKSPLNFSEFKNYFLSNDAFIVISGGKRSSYDFDNDLEKNIIIALC